MTDREFDQLISEVMDDLPQQYIAGLDNVAITYSPEPTAEQRRTLQLRGGQTLFGLYEGIPITQRAAANSIFSPEFAMPDVITIFKNPIVAYAAGDQNKLRRQVKHTLWHEIAHYYGLDHSQIHDLEDSASDVDVGVF